jgi:type IV secretory pathway VirJ component
VISASSKPMVAPCRLHGQIWAVPHPYRKPENWVIDGTKIQCIYGDEEDDTGCTAPELAQADRLKMPGGHHFGGDYETVTRAILKAARFS